MRLMYRGIPYEYNPEQARVAHTQRSPYTLSYRGARYLVDPTAIAETPVVPSEYPLVYRGAKYTMNSTAQAVVPVLITEDNRPAVEVVRSTLKSKFSAQAELAKIHQANLLQNLQRRLQVAQERGDQQLINLLEAERQQIIA